MEEKWNESEEDKVEKKKRNFKNKDSFSKESISYERPTECLAR
jgi:hypothetical protein